MTSLALGTLLVAYLLLPGFVFYYGLVIGGTASKDSPQNLILIPRSLGYALVVSIGLHTMWGVMIQFAAFLELVPIIDYNYFLKLLEPKSVNTTPEIDNALVPPILLGLSAYLGSQICVAWFGGKGLAFLRQTRGFYAKSQLTSNGALWRMRLDPSIFNEAGWTLDDIDYPLRSVIWGDKDQPYEDEEKKILRIPDAVSLTVGFEHGSTMTLYRGLVGPFEISDHGNLDLVCLWGAYRKIVQLDPNISNGGDWKRLHEQVVLDLTDCSHLAFDIDYIWLDELEEELEEEVV